MASGATDQQNGGKERKNSGAPLRTRKSNGKSRGGCLVCKKRRIKVRGFCDDDEAFCRGWGWDRDVVMI